MGVRGEMVWKLFGGFKVKLFLVAILVLCSSCTASRWSVKESPPALSYEQALIDRYSSGEIPSLASETAEGRNHFIAEILYLSNVAFDDYEQSLYRSSSTFEIVTDLLILGLSSSSALAAGNVVKTVLAATAAATSGMKTAVDRSYFKEQSRLALLAKMREMRQKRLVIIRSSMELPIEVYPLTDAMLDLQAYNGAGSILAALQRITEEASMGLTVADQELLHLRGADFDLEASY